VSFCRGRMADKKSQKASSSKSKLSPKFEPFSPTSQEIILRNSPFQLVDHFTTLGTIPPRPSFHSALVNQYDPFAVSSQPKPPYNPKPYAKTSAYYAKSPVQNLFYVESDLSHLKIAEALAKAYYPSLWHFPAIHPHKSLKFYRDILFQTKLVQINPIMDNIDKTKIVYHSFYIMKILNQSKWGSHPHTCVKLDGHSVEYCYHDYIEAWSKIFLHQNETYSHSWFINFDKNFKGNFPLWFLCWWQVHGPINEIVPEQIQEVIRIFSSVHKLSQHEVQLPIMLHFFSRYKVPWILKWQYAVNSNCVSRQWHVKWWDKFKISQTIDRFNSEYPIQATAPPAAQLSQPEPDLQSLKAPKPSKADLPPHPRGKRQQKRI
jgi:hypothetical protein